MVLISFLVGVDHKYGGEKLGEVALVSLPESGASVGGTVAEAFLRVSSSAPMHVSDLDSKAGVVL